MIPRASKNSKFFFLIILILKTFQKTIRKNICFVFVSKYLKIAFEIKCSFPFRSKYTALSSSLQHKSKLRYSAKWKKKQILKAILRYLETKSKLMFFLIVFFKCCKKLNYQKKNWNFLRTSGLEPAILGFWLQHYTTVLS